jgi:tetratricopeptide (TPR) repeat protein
VPKYLLTMFSLVFLSAFSALAQDGAPKLDPVPGTPEQKALINAGTALHDRRDFDGAIAKYQEVLRENPDNVEAMYELSYSLYAKGNYQESITQARKGTQYKSRLLAQFYMEIGNAQDDLGDSAKAIETYRTGIKLIPSEALLHYNLAVSLNKLGKSDEARASAKRSASLNPAHPSSQLLLSSLFDQGSYKTPALLAACRFLILEPDSSRSTGALTTIQNIFGSFSQPGSKPNSINIFLDTNAKKDEGDFGAADLTLGLASAKTEKDAGKSEIQLKIERFNTIFAVLGEMAAKDDRTKFTWKYYIPYFYEMKQRNYVEPFVYYIYQRQAINETAVWLENPKNRTRLDELLAWSKQYSWPAVE